MKIIGLIGKTSSGKDTIARYLYKRYCIEPIISYTTRPMRESEVDGREHWFVDDKKMDEVLSNKTKILAFMENPDKTWDDILEKRVQKAPPGHSLFD